MSPTESPNAVNDSRPPSPNPTAHQGLVPVELTISVIIVSWNARRFLKECLESLSSGIMRSHEVIVVDNASSDGSATMVAQEFPWVKLIESGGNLGFSKANNIGIRHANGRYLALVNSDVKVLPNCIDQLAAFLDDHPRVGMVGPRVMYGDLRLQTSCRQFPNLWNTACEVFQLYKLFPHTAFFSGEEMFYFPHDRTCPVEVLVGCFIVARRFAVDQFGLWDENFWMYGEDLDWCRRCSDAGWKLIFYPGAKAIHYGGGSSASHRTLLAVAQLHARRQLWAKYYSRPTRAVFFFLLALQSSLRIAISGFTVLARLTGREDAANRMRVEVACLRALLGRRASPFQME
jgi:hypothetical protein